MKTSTFIRVLEESVRRNGGNKPLTLGHLLNLVKLTARHEEREAEREEKFLDDLAHEIEMDRTLYKD